MNLKAKRGKEVTVKIINRIGILADLAKFLADRGVNLLALNATVVDDQAIIRLITDDNLRAEDVLREHGYNPHEEDVVLLTIPHKPGMLHRVSEILAEAMIDTHHIYATTTDSNGDCCVVLHTANDDQALIKFNEVRIGV
ncbi:MAG: ACT domain-containing protein [Coraliomargarita sp.]